jgi:ATP-grasp ribosomal peptide maturase
VDTSDVVLVLSADDDATADAVIEKLIDRGVRVIGLDSGDFPIRLRLSATTSQLGWKGRLRTDREQVHFEEIRSVYFRRPTRFQFDEGMSQADEVFAAAEARLGFGGVLTSMEALWVNHPARIAAAEYKPFQLHHAVHSGLTVPQTLVGNDHAEAVLFARQLGKPVVCKTFSSLVFAEDGHPHTTFTTPIDPANIDPAQFAATAHLVQEWVPKAYEARVTVVGREPFAVAITSETEAGRVDWRSDYDALSYEQIDIPAAVTVGISQFMDRLGLNFGAFDFVITPEGGWVMLECNPAGQWLWLEHETGIPIADALAGLLAKGAKR